MINQYKQKLKYIMQTRYKKSKLIYRLYCRSIMYALKGSWICIAPHCEKLASEALTYGSHSFLAAEYTTPSFTS